MELLSSSPQLNRFTVKQQKLCKLEHLHTAGTHVQGFSSTSGRALRITSWSVECAVSPPWTGQDFTASSLQVAVLVTSLHFLHHLSSHWHVLSFPCHISAKLLRYKRNIWSPNQGHNTGPRSRIPLAMESQKLAKSITSTGLFQKHPAWLVSYPEVYPKRKFWAYWSLG